MPNPPLAFLLPPVQCYKQLQRDVCGVVVNINRSAPCDPSCVKPKLSLGQKVKWTSNDSVVGQHYRNVQE